MSVCLVSFSVSDLGTRLGKGFLSLVMVSLCGINSGLCLCGCVFCVCDVLFSLRKMFLCSFIFFLSVCYGVFSLCEVTVSIWVSGRLFIKSCLSVI